MVFVPGGDYRLISWSRPTDRRVRLDDYFIDKYEVSNQEYKEFINAGGYLKRELWSASLRQGRPDAVVGARRFALLVDRTGLPGPRTWSNQSFPDGKADVSGHRHHVVRGGGVRRLSRQTAGDDLPVGEGRSQRLSSPAAGVVTMPWGVFYPGYSLYGRANFGTSTCPRRPHEFGMSAFGVYNMAGNVAEWTFQRQFGRVSRDRRSGGRSVVRVLAVRRAARLLQFREAGVSLRPRRRPDCR